VRAHIGKRRLAWHGCRVEEGREGRGNGGGRSRSDQVLDWGRFGSLAKMARLRA
jgi:hypothetical protein